MAQNYKLKLILVGEPSVGKTSLIKKFVESQFPKDYLPTLGSNFYNKTIMFKSKENLYHVEIGIWDIAGQKEWLPLRSQYYKGANGVFIVGDVTIPETISQINSFWMNDVISNIDHDKPIILLLNKIDLSSNLSTKELDQLKMHPRIKSVLKTSAKTGENVHQAFIELMKQIFSINELIPMSLIKK